MDLNTQRETVRSFIETSLKRWATAGFDHQSGTFMEALDFDGNPLPELPRRGRVQARQVYVYALAHRYGFDPSGEYIRLSEHGYASAEPIYLNSKGGWHFLASSAGEVLDGKRNAYEQAFLIMALSALYRATQNRVYAEKTETSWQWLEELCVHQQGGFQLCIPIHTQAPREQNPHMHLFEACLEAAPIDQQKWLKRAQELAELAERHFITPDGRLLEYFDADWAPHPERGGDLQPGHLFEWVWLLTQYQNRVGGSIPAIERLYDVAMKWGLDDAGLGYDEISSDGQILRGTKRLWVQCEVLKGHLARYETTRGKIYLDRAQKVLEQTFRHYLIADKGIWFDQLDEQNRNISENSPASTFYHLFIALHEFLRVMS